MNAVRSIALGVALVALAAGCTTTTAVAPATTPATTVIVPPGSTVAVVQTAAWCGGTHASTGGTNFGSCPPAR
jgi:hypothetical protein